MNKKQELANIFVAESIKYGEARNVGNSKQLDKQSDLISKIEKELSALGGDEINVLQEFLDHDNEFVRLHTALSLLKTGSNAALEVLTNLTKVRGPVAVEARIILSQWGKANL